MTTAPKPDTNMFSVKVRRSATGQVRILNLNREELIEELGSDHSDVLNADRDGGNW